MIVCDKTAQLLKSQTIEREVRQRIWDKIDELKINPFPKGVEHVLGKKEKSFRVRIGKYRVQFVVFKDKNEVAIFNVDKRERAYD